MARYTRPTDAQIDAYREWVASRPAAIRDVIRRHSLEPWTLYRLYHVEPDGSRTPNQRVTILSFSEAGATPGCAGHDGTAGGCGHHHIAPTTGVTLTVSVMGLFNAVAFERNVVGIDPLNLEECDLPDDAEMVGCAGLTEEEMKLPGHIQRMLVVSRADGLRPFSEARKELAGGDN